MSKLHDICLKVFYYGSKLRNILNVKTIIEGIEALPPLSKSLQLLQNEFAHEEADFKKLMQIIEKDPILTANILKQINSPLNGLKKQVSNLSQALPLMGIASIKGTVYQLLIQKSFELNMKVYNVSNEQFRALCILQSRLMFLWFMRVDIEMAKKLIPLSFIMETGKIIIANEIVNSSYKKQFSQEIRESDCRKIEKEYIGLDTFEVNAYLFKRWHLDPDYIDIMQFNEKLAHVRELHSAVKIVQLIVNINGLFNDKNIEQAMSIAKECSFDTAKLERSIGTLRALL